MATRAELERGDQLSTLWSWFDLPMAKWLEGIGPLSDDDELLRVEQEMTDDSMVIRAEMPGIDPDKDVQITVSDGVLVIRGQRRFERKQDDGGRTRTEFRYGSFSRALSVPDGMDPDDVTATYRDGILEVRFPYKVPSTTEPRKVEVTRS
jgi:HSP20 family protein